MLSAPACPDERLDAAAETFAREVAAELRAGTVICRIADAAASG